MSKYRRWNDVDEETMKLNFLKRNQSDDNDPSSSNNVTPEGATNSESTNSHFYVSDAELYEVIDRIKQIELSVKCKTTLKCTRPPADYELTQENTDFYFNCKGEILLPHPNDGKATVEDDDDPSPRLNLQDMFALSCEPEIPLRQAAFQAIIGVLDYSQKGYYDNIFDLPLKNIFFLFRYAMDENIASIIELSAIGVALLFYHESDEILTDVLYDMYGGHIQQLRDPDHKIVQRSWFDYPTDEEVRIEEDMSENLAECYGDGRLCSFQTAIDLINMNLMECLLRTNTLLRIYHIVHYMRTDSTIPISCFKILISMAYSSKKMRTALVNSDKLLRSLIASFLPKFQQEEKWPKNSNDVYDYPQHMMLKLIRILLVTEPTFLRKFKKFKLFGVIKRYIRVTSNLNLFIVKIQIECFRLLKCLSILTDEYNILEALHSSLYFYMNMHYDQLAFDDPDSLIIRQHACAIFSVIYTKRHITLGVFRKFKKLIIDCCTKWFVYAMNNGMPEITSSALLCSSLDSLTVCLKYRDLKMYTFFYSVLRTFYSSVHFKDYIRNMIEYSNIFNCEKRPRNANKSLPYLGSVIQYVKPGQIGLDFAVNFDAPYNLLYSILRFKKRSDELEMMKRGILQTLTFPESVCITFADYLCCYTRKQENINYTLVTNYFVQTEIRCIAALLQCAEVTSHLSGSEMFHVVFNFVRVLSENSFRQDANFYTNVLFTSQYINIDEFVQENWQKVYNLQWKDRGSPLAVHEMLSVDAAGPVLPADWPFAPLRKICKNRLSGKSAAVTEYTHRDVILCVLRFVNNIREYCPTLVLCTPTEQLMYFMMVYFTADYVYLEEDINLFLMQQIYVFFKECENIYYDFDTVIDGISFEELYYALLIQFQGCPYNDAVFSALVMVPLAQKYDLKWRKYVWLEHMAALRYVSCDNSMLIGGLAAYNSPCEKELVLLRNYYYALAHNILIPNSLAYKISYHHLTSVLIYIGI